MLKIARTLWQGLDYRSAISHWLGHYRTRMIVR